MMKSSLIKYLIFMTAVFVLMFPFTTAFYFEQHPSHTVSKLESTIASMPLAISASEADAILGTQPDSISSANGVFANPTMLLDASNEQATKYGSIQSYSLRIWKQDDVIATVAIDDSGKVAGRWTWNKNKARNHNQFSLGRFLTSLTGLFR